MEFSASSVRAPTDSTWAGNMKLVGVLSQPSKAKTPKTRMSTAYLQAHVSMAQVNRLEKTPNRKNSVASSLVKGFSLGFHVDTFLYSVLDIGTFTEGNSAPF
jgi:hypothetical protein